MDRNQQESAASGLSAGAFWDASRTFMALVRPQYLPTVLSNCIAGWWLGGGGNARGLFFVFCGAVLMFAGGALLNDAFDIGHDRAHRRGRPVPSGRIGLRTVWRAGLLLLLIATVALQWPGRVTGGIGMALALAVVLHNSMHRWMPFSPALLGVCRFLLYLLGASVAVRGITGAAVWGGIAVAVYVSGLESLHRDDEHRLRKLWHVLAAGAPIVLALSMNAGSYFVPAIILCTVLVSWFVLSWRMLGPVGGLNLFVPGIVLVDVLAVCPAPISIYLEPISAPRELGFLFVGLFGAALLLSLLNLVGRTTESTGHAPRAESLRA